MRPPSTPRVQRRPRDRGRQEALFRAGLVGPATLWSRRRPTSPPLFAPFAAALVLSDALRQPRCDLPGHRVGVFHRKNDRVVIEETPAKTLLQGRGLGLVAADSHEDRRVLEKRLHHRRQHLAAAILK